MSRMINEHLSREGRTMKRKGTQIKVCQHYLTFGGGIHSGQAISLLQRVSSTKCVCTQCKKEFPIKVYWRMVKLTKRFSAHSGCTEILSYKMKISEAIPPVKYYYVGDVIHYVM